MVTMVGMQENFGNALKALLELEYDALEAYDESIKQLKDIEYKQKMRDFRGDHEHHIQTIINLLKVHDIDFTPGPDLKKWLTKGKVIISALINDTTILKAMLTNEIETNVAYERMYNHDNIWEDAKAFIKEGFADEKRHKQWLESV